VAFSYGSNITTFTDTKSKKTIYQFNDWGNTMNTKDSLGYASYSKYNETSGSSSKNRVTVSSKLQRTVANYVKNHSMELTTTWTGGYTPGATATGGRTTTTAFNGSLTSFKIDRTNIIGRYHIKQDVTLVKGNTYTLSAYIKTDSITNTMGKGAALYVTYKNSAGTDVTVDSEYINGTSTDWTRSILTFTLPVDSTSTTVTVCGGIVEEDGIAYFDAFQLEDGSVANRYSMVENGDFRGGSMEAWWESVYNDSGDAITTTTPPSNVPIDGYVFRISGNPNYQKLIGQTINVSGTEADTFVVSGWGRADSAPLTSGTDRRFGLLIGFVHSDGTIYYYGPNMNPDASDWQYSSFVAKSDKAFTSIKVYCRFYDNVNNAYFDGIRLYKEEFGDSFTYDADGNLVSAVDLAKQNSGFEYSVANDLTKATDPKGKEFDYVYDTKHNVTSATTPTNVVYSFTYDSNGNPLTTKIGSTSDATLYIDSSATYTDNNNYLNTLTDPSGNTIVNTWEPTKGLLSTMEDGRDNVTNYYYNSNTDQLTQVSKNVGGTAATVGYAYQNDKLQSITRNSFAYVFGYDSMGNNTTVKAGTQPLLTNTFEARTSLLTSTAYANGQTINYVYDETNRVTQRKSGPTVKFTYEYDASGNLGYHKDLQNPNNIREYRFVYDVADRLISVAENNGNELTYEYDVNNNTNKISDKVGGNTYTTEYAVDEDNRPKDTIWTAGSTTRKQTIAYDLLGRTSSKTLFWGANDIRTTNYSYLPGVNGSSTSKVGMVTDEGVDTTYTYDPNGNISTITTGGQTITYFYDELNQLVRENNQVQNLTITYSYDIGGNLTEKKTYAYTTADPIVGTPTSTITSVYNDSVWKDKLTSYNGNTITYDNVGNPLTYAGYTYTWEEGRQLAGISGNSQTISYTYNDQGIRQSKTVNGVTTNYRLVGDRVSWEGNGTDSIYYTYDGSGNLISMNLNGTEYFYTRNLQGDITGLIDNGGAQVVTYTYDSWGSVLSITGTLASTLGQKNPYRYRGYRLDSETGMYYLNSRYYVPEWGRLFSPDVVMNTTGDLNGYNLYAYAANSPAGNADSSGFFVETALDVTSAGVSAYEMAKNPSWLNMGMLVWDVAAICIPVLPGSYALKATKVVANAVDSAGDAGKLYHYTSANPESIMASGLKGGESGNVFLTPNGMLSPLQAQIDLALKPNRGLPEHLFEIDIQDLSALGYNIPKPQLIARMFNMPGGGLEVIISGPIPPSVIRMVK
jgi:RHS repeat-associated protein